MKTKYPISGTFIDEITYDIPSSNWSDKQWSKDLDHMKSVGIDTLIFIRGGFCGKTIFPTNDFPTLKDADEDFAGFILKEAAKRNMNVYIGLYITDLTWSDGDYRTEIEKNNLFIDIVLKKYGHIPSFKGWYIPHEVGNDVFNITEIYSGLSALCKHKSPDKKILISPFFLSPIMIEKGALTPKQTYTEWDKIFTKANAHIDYCAFQDGSAPLHLMDQYFAAAKQVCEKHNIELWANIEGMSRNHSAIFAPIAFEDLKTKIRKVKPYVNKLIMFEFSHFLSPQSINLSARNLHFKYKNYYKKNPF